jgi:ribosomal protein L3 glutamine methyltransferase
MTLIELIIAQSARLKQAGVSFGHGTANAFDESAWLVLWALGLPLDALEVRAQNEVAPDEQAKAEALVTRRIETRQPAAYLTREAWLQNVPFYVDERVIVPRSFIAELLADGEQAGTLDAWLSGYHPLGARPVHRQRQPGGDRGDGLPRGGGRCRRHF